MIYILFIHTEFKKENSEQQRCKQQELNYGNDQVMFYELLHFLFLISSFGDLSRHIQHGLFARLSPCTQLINTCAISVKYQINNMLLVKQSKNTVHFRTKNRSYLPQKERAVAITQESVVIGQRFIVDSFPVAVCKCGNQ